MNEVYLLLMAEDRARQIAREIAVARMVAGGRPNADGRGARLARLLRGLADRIDAENPQRRPDRLAQW